MNEGTEVTDLTANRLRSTRRNARGTSICLLTGGGILILGAMRSMSLAEICLDVGLSAMICGTVMTVGWLLACNQETIMVKVITDQEEMRGQLAQVQVFEARQVRVLTEALDEITPHTRRRYN